MNLLCINNYCPDFGVHPYLKYFGVYEAVGESLCVDGVPCYEIPSLPNSMSDSDRLNNKPLYRKSRFVSLDEPIELELTNIKEEFI